VKYVTSVLFNVLMYLSTWYGTLVNDQDNMYTYCNER